MERGGRYRRTPSACSVNDRWQNLQHLIDCDGTITIGEVVPVTGTAVAAQGRQVYAMLRINNSESLVEILDRLDTAVAKALDDDTYTDEINR